MANISSINGNPIVVGTDGVEDNSITNVKLARNGGVLEKVSEIETLISGGVENLWDGSYMHGVRTVGASSNVQLQYYNAEGMGAGYKTAKIQIEIGHEYSIIAESGSYMVAIESSQDIVINDFTATNPINPENKNVVLYSGSTGKKNVTFTATQEYLYICYTMTGESYTIFLYEGEYDEQQLAFYNKNEIDIKFNTVNASLSEVDSILDEITTEYDIVLDYTSTENQCVTGTGAIVNMQTSLHTASLQVSEGVTYNIRGSVQYANAYYAFYNSSLELVLLGPVNVGGTAAAVTFDVEAVAPEGASYLYVNYLPNAQTAVISATERKVTVKKWVGLNWVCVGDSLTAENTATTKHYYDYVAQDTGITPINMGANGTGYAKASGSGEAFYNRVLNVPTDADVVTIFGSFNDLSSGLDFGSVNDTGTDTIAGCINTTIDNLQSRIPLVKLGIVSPTPWDTTRPNFVESSNSYKYFHLLEDICKVRSIPFLDMWYASNLHPWDAAFRAVAYTKDNGSGTHPDENGHKLISARFKTFLGSLIL